MFPDKGLPKALVKPNNILTHVIEGYVIQEAAEPFAVSTLPLKLPTLRICILKFYWTSSIVQYAGAITTYLLCKAVFVSVLIISMYLPIMLNPFYS